jgi:hypothetical protein
MRRAVLGLTVLALVSAVARTPAYAGTRVASYASPPCPTTVATWRIAYRMYWADTEGHTTSREPTAEVLDRVQQFVDDVSVDSACGVRAEVDVYDEEGALWPASTESESLPADSQTFETGGGYDWIFYRFPSNGEAYCADTSPSAGPAEGTLPSVSRFPVDPEGHLGCDGGPASSDCTCEPWNVLMEHEWLHAVVAFYNPRLGWPVPDVHGACEHGYTQKPCPGAMTNETYFSDMMQGKVPENGGLRGIQSDEWTLQGTPANPRIRHPTLLLSGGGQSRAVSFPADLGTGVGITIKNSAGVVVEQLTAPSPGWEFALPGAGSWEVCLQTSGSEAYYRATSCFSSYVESTTETPSKPATAVSHRVPVHLRITHRDGVYRLLAVDVPRGVHVSLVVSRPGHAHQILSGKNRRGTVLFALKGAWEACLERPPKNRCQ